MNIREYQRGEKPIIHQSNLKHYFRCPKKYKLSINPDIEIETSKAQNQGLLVESYLWGFKGNTEEEKLEYQSILEKFDCKSITAGRKAIIENAQKCAEIVKPYFPEDSEPFCKMEYDDGEMIYTVEFDNFHSTAIRDLKVTTKMPEVWGFMDWKGDTIAPDKFDMLQPLFYKWVYFKMTGQEIPWQFVVVDWDLLCVKTLEIRTSLNDFNWLETQLIKFKSELFWDAKPCFKNCLKGKYGERCPYLPYCDEGKDFMKGELNRLDYQNLSENLL